MEKMYAREVIFAKCNVQAEDDVDRFLNMYEETANLTEQEWVSNFERWVNS